MEETQTNVKGETVKLIFELVGLVATYFVTRYLMEADYQRSVKMRSALMVKRVARWQEETWCSIGDKAASMYQRERW